MSEIVMDDNEPNSAWYSCDQENCDEIADASEFVSNASWHVHTHYDGDNSTDFMFCCRDHKLDFLMRSLE